MKVVQLTHPYADGLFAHLGFETRYELHCELYVMLSRVLSRQVTGSIIMHEASAPVAPYVEAEPFIHPQVDILLENSGHAAPIAIKYTLKSAVQQHMRRIEAERRQYPSVV